MVGYQMLSMPNDIRGPRYCQPTIKGSSLNSGKRPLSSTASDVLDTGSYMWKCNIWGNDDFPSSVLGRNLREPHAVRENNSTASFRSPESLTSYDSLVSSSEAEGCPRLPFINKRSGFQEGQRSQLEYASPSEAREIARQHSNNHAVLANRSLSKSPGNIIRDCSLGKISSRLPTLMTDTFGHSSHRANSPSSSAGATFPTWTEQVSPTESRANLSSYLGSTSRGTSHSSSLPPSQQGNDSVAFANSLESLSHGRLGNKPSAHTPFVTLTEPVTSFRTDNVPSFQGLSIDDNKRTSLLAAEPNSIQGNQRSAFDSRYAVQNQSAPRKHATYPHSYSFSQAVNSPDNVLPHQFLAYNSKQRHTYPTDHRLNHSSNSTIQQGPLYHSTELSPSTENNHYTSRSAQQIGQFTNSRFVSTGRDLRSPYENHHLLDPQLQQILVSAQAQAQLNALGFGNVDRTPMGKYPQNVSVSSFHPVVSMQECPTSNRDQDSCTAVRSTLMHEFKSNNRTNKRYELKDIYEHIAEFSGDQHGSRFIQQKLENATSDEKERVFQEIQPNIMQLACDVFGNYVIQKFFEHGDQNQKKTLANRMKGHVLSLSLQTYACRVVQKALEHILVDQQVTLIRELESHVIRCVKDQNGNHVIQKAIERLPSEHIQFIIDAFAGQVQSLASHSYGCRVIQRLLEYAQESPKRAILQELHACVPALISDQFGNYVTQHMIEHGGPHDRAVIIKMIHNHLVSFATHKFASNVVEKGLVYASDEQRRIMLHQLLQSDDRGDSAIGKLIQCGYGNYVLQKFLDTLNPTDYATFIEALQPELHKAKRINAGNGVKNIPAIVKKMRRFDGLSSSSQDHTFSNKNLSLYANTNNSTLPSSAFPYNNISVEAI